MNLQDTATRVHADKPDILVNLNGYTKVARLPQLRTTTNRVTHRAPVTKSLRCVLPPYKSCALVTPFLTALESDGISFDDLGRYMGFPGSSGASYMHVSALDLLRTSKGPVFD